MTAMKTVHWLLLALLVFGTAEAYCRVARLAPENQDRFLEPYLMTGNEASPPYRGAPADYGYEKRGLLYYYPYRHPITSMAERDFVALPTSPLPRDAKRVYVVGGSVARGDYGSPGHRWWQILEQKLRQDLKDERIVVLPAATASWVSTQERIALEFFVIPNQPKAVILVDGVNDATNAGLLSRPGDPYNQGILYSRYYSPWFQVLRAISNHSAFVRYWLLRSIRAQVDGLDHEVLNDPSRQANQRNSIASVYTSNLKAMENRCAQESLRCLFVLQPLGDLTRKYTDPGFRAPGLDIYETLVSEFRKLSARQPTRATRVSFHDFTHLMDGERSKYYVDGVHFYDPGQDLLATEVEKELLRSQALR